MSAWEGYLSFGGNEIVNADRTRAVAEGADCPMFWLMDETCGTLADALGDPPYGPITDAPWYDPNAPASEDFYGFYATSITEVYDSTRQVQAVENIDDGGVLGRTRKAMKTMRVKGLVMGHGRPAIEYGLAWLSAALDPGACGQHGTKCGTSDLLWLADCPPERIAQATWVIDTPGQDVDHPAVEVFHESGGSSTLPLDHAWTAFLDDPGDTDATVAQVLHGAGIAGDDSDWEVGVYSQAFWNIIQTQNRGPALHLTTAEVPALTNGRSYTLTGFAFSPSGYLPRVTLGGASWQGADTASPQPFTVHWTATGGLADLTLGVVNNPAATDPKPISGTWFDTISISQDAWTEHVPEVGHWEPETDEAYHARIANYWLFLHDVAAISGPLVANTLTVGENWAYDVEVVFQSEHAYIYGLTELENLPTTSSTVVSDIPYNLVLHPSAELADTNVVVAKNFVPNPSVETDASGWFTGTDVITPAAVGARSTALAAAGAASYAATTTTTNAGVNGAISAWQTFPVAFTAGQALSVSVWAAFVKTSGAAVAQRIRGRVEWKDSGGTVLRSDYLGPIDPAGGVLSLKSQFPPAGTVQATVVTAVDLASWAIGDKLALYSDAMALTLP